MLVTQNGFKPTTFILFIFFQIIIWFHEVIFTIFWNSLIEEYLRNKWIGVIFECWFWFSRTIPTDTRWKNAFETKKHPEMCFVLMEREKKRKWNNREDQFFQLRRLDQSLNPNLPLASKEPTQLSPTQNPLTFAIYCN